MDSTTSSEAIDQQPVVLTVAGSDPSSGAGIQADLRVFSKLGLFGTSAVTAITSQNTREVHEVFPLPPEQVSAQIDAVSDDFTISAAKTGMLPTTGIVEVLAKWFKQNRTIPLVIDPVYRSSSGFRLVEHDALLKATELLWPLCDLVAPNVYEAGVISGKEIDSDSHARDAARALNSMGAGAVCITGCNWNGSSTDIFFDGDTFEEIPGEKISGAREYHGTGCIFSAAATSYIALGMSTLNAVKEAKKLVEEAITGARSPGDGMAIPWL